MSSTQIPTAFVRSEREQTSSEYSDERLGGSSQEHNYTTGVEGRVVPEHEISYNGGPEA